jgi:parallel beta-helix repeat protein
VRAARGLRRLLLPALVLGLTSGAVHATTAPVLYVDRGNAACSDAGAGTVDQPFCTIGAAAARVAAGQTVQVASGTYPERVVVQSSGVAGSPIVFAAAPGASVTLSGQLNGFYLSGRSWVTIRGFNVINTTDYGIAVNNSSQITLADNHVSYSGQPVSGYTKYGIRLNNVSDSVVTGNITDHNTNAGIGLVSGSTRNQVTGNQSFNNAEGYQRAAAGIHLYSAPGNTISGNIAHDNEDSGINVYPGSTDCVVYNNVTYRNGDHGIDDSFAANATIVANTVYKNVTAGINVEGQSTGATLANNISVDNGIKSPRTHSDIRVESGSTSGTTMDNDLVFLTTADTLLIWNSVSYTSLAAFQAASGQEARGIQGDPDWANPTGGDFHLTAGSPAIDSANSGASDQPAVDVEGNQRVDDPATPNSGSGPRPYDDRGAYEFQATPAADAPPAAQLTASPTSGAAPLALTADASASTDGDATPIVSYSFDFGDGTSPIGPQASPVATHTYATAGIYTVVVTATDTAGLASTASATVTATSPPPDSPPAAALSLTPSSGTINLAVTADGSASTDGDLTPIASYAFDFGDGTAVGPQPGAAAVHTYTTPGTYTVTLTVTDTAGLVASATAQVTVTDNPPSVTLKVSPSNGTAPLTVTASASASDGDATPVANYTFDFGDGSPRAGPQTTPSVSHTYFSPGTYQVTVTVTDSAGLAATATKDVKVRR